MLTKKTHQTNNHINQQDASCPLTQAPPQQHTTHIISRSMDGSQMIPPDRLTAGFKPVFPPAHQPYECKSHPNNSGKHTQYLQRPNQCQVGQPNPSPNTTYQKQNNSLGFIQCHIQVFFTLIWRIKTTPNNLI